MNPLMIQFQNDKGICNNDINDLKIQNKHIIDQ